MRVEPYRLDPSSYSTWVEVTTRESDVDSQDHINSLWLTFFFREAWTKLQTEIVGPRDRSVRDRRFLVARITFDYLDEVLHPSVVHVGAGVLAIGRTSLSLGCGAFHRGVAAAVADYTVVHADAHGPTPWPDDVRQRAASRLITGILTARPGSIRRSEHTED
jgi:acyl-CoA thioester hydrolase